MRKIDKKNPPAATGGLAENSDQTDTNTGDQFVSAFFLISQEGEEFDQAFRTILRARDLVQKIVDLWIEVDGARQSKKVGEGWDGDAIQLAVRDADVIYRECYRWVIVRDFEVLFGVDYETFEVSLNELRDAFRGDGSDL